MSGPPEPAETLTPAEQALTDHLALLRHDPPASTATMVANVVRTARWQRAIRRPLSTVGTLAAAIRDGIGLLFAPSGRR